MAYIDEKLRIFRHSYTLSINEYVHQTQKIKVHLCNVYKASLVLRSGLGLEYGQLYPVSDLFMAGNRLLQIWAFRR